MKDVLSVSHAGKSQGFRLTLSAHSAFVIRHSSFGIPPFILHPSSFPDGAFDSE